MNEKLREIQREVDNLKKQADELKLLKSDIDTVKKIRDKFVTSGFD